MLESRTRRILAVCIREYRGPKHGHQLGVALVNVEGCFFFGDMHGRNGQACLGTPVHLHEVIRMNTVESR